MAECLIGQAGEPRLFRSGGRNTDRTLNEFLSSTYIMAGPVADSTGAGISVVQVLVLSHVAHFLTVHTGEPGSCQC